MTFRTEKIGDQTLILGDCLAVMPTLGKVDAVDVSDAVVYSQPHEKPAKRQHRSPSRSDESMGAAPCRDMGALRERAAFSRANGATVRGDAGGLSEGAETAWHTGEAEGQTGCEQSKLQARTRGEDISDYGGQRRLRDLRGDGKPLHPPQGRGPLQQHVEQSGGDVHELPLVDAQGRVVALPQGWAIVTDPPYGIGFGEKHTKWSANRGTRLGNWDATIPDVGFLAEICSEVIIWGGERFGLPIRRRWLTWVKPDAAPTFASTEFAWTSFDAPARHFTYAVGSVNKERVGHPTQKPVALMEWCLGFLPDAETILDPFMGSGTTLVACAKLGRKGIGIEIDPDYFEIAVERVRKAYEQPDLFVPQPKKIIHQKDMFDE